MVEMDVEGVEVFIEVPLQRLPMLTLQIGVNQMFVVVVVTMIKVHSSISDGMEMV